MNRNESRDLRAQRGQLHADMAKIASSTTPEDVASWDKMNADQEALRVRIERIETSLSLQEGAQASGAPPAGQPGDQPQGSEAEAKRANELREKAFKLYLRHGHRREVWPDAEWTEFQNLRQAGMRLEARDMGESGLGTGAATGAGVFVPVGFVQNIVEAMKYYGPMLDGGAGMPTIMDTTTGQSLPWPTDNDTTISGELIGEGQQVSTQDVTIGQVIFGAYKFSSKLIKVSLELLQDSAFDLDSYLVKKFATRLGRAANTYLTTGTGTNQPKGIAAGATLGVTFAGANTNDGVSGANTIGSDDLTNLEHAVDPLYRRGARYMFHDTTLQAIKKIKDKYGRMLWMPSMREGEPDMINSYRYAINNDMAQLQTAVSSPTVTNKTVLFGDLSLYTIRRVKEMSVLRLEERFADYGQVAFIAFSRLDGQLLDAGTHPVQYGQNTY